MAFATSALVRLHPRQQYTPRDWALGAAVAVFVVALSYLPHPIRFWILVPGMVLSTLPANYAQHLGRITVTSDLIRVQCWGSVTEHARARIVTIRARSEGVQVALNDGRWVLFSWPFFIPRRERHARACGLLTALGGVSEDDAA